MATERIHQVVEVQRPVPLVDAMLREDTGQCQEVWAKR